MSGKDPGHFFFFLKLLLIDKQSQFTHIILFKPVSVIFGAVANAIRITPYPVSYILFQVLRE